MSKVIRFERKKVNPLHEKIDSIKDDREKLIEFIESVRENRKGKKKKAKIEEMMRVGHGLHKTRLKVTRPSEVVITKFSQENQ